MDDKLMPRASRIWLCDIVYLIPWIFGLLNLHSIRSWTSAVVLAVLIAAWRQEWKASRRASVAYSDDLILVDLLSAANYVGIVYGLQEAPSGTFPISGRAAFHWAAIFILYIAWNLSATPYSNADTRRVLIYFSLAEVPVAIFSAAIAASASLDRPPGLRLTESQALAAVMTLGFIHCALLFAWGWIITKKARIQTSAIPPVQEARELA